jgi:diaminopimelate epimerase
VPVLSFSKYQGLGNDFIVVDARKTRMWVSAACAARLCDRRRGIGGDGVITVLPSREPAAELRMHIYNADGSEAEMCGNGLRCVVQAVLGSSRAQHLVVDTDAGIREGWLEGDRVRVTLGTARLLFDRVDANDRVGAGISMGNPHLVLRPVASKSLIEDARRLGPELERHPQFPNRVNVGFMEPIAREAIRLVVFERGAGITQACGTGAGAAVVAAMRWGLVNEGRVKVELPGGPLEVAVEGDVHGSEELGRVQITGDARHSFEGSATIEDSELAGSSAPLA